MSAPTIPDILERAKDRIAVWRAGGDTNDVDEAVDLVLSAGLMWFDDAEGGFEPTDRAFKISFEGRAILALAEAILND